MTLFADLVGTTSVDITRDQVEGRPEVDADPVSRQMVIAPSWVEEIDWGGHIVA